MRLCAVVVLFGWAAPPSNCGCWADSVPPSRPRLVVNEAGQNQNQKANEYPTWNATAKKSASGYRISSITNLNGKPGANLNFVEIASGSFHDWRWKVNASSSLLPAWKVYESARRVHKSASLAADDWSYPAFDWNRAFERTYLLAKYLFGREPVALNATVLLIPDAQEYRAHFDQADAGIIPITLGFPFPTDAGSSKKEQASRMAAILQAVTEIAHQYSRVLIDENVISTTGQGEALRNVNKEAEAACWMESTAMVFVAANGHFRSTMQWNQQASADDLKRRPPSEIPADKVGYWASLREAESISGYLEMKGLKNRSFSGKDPAAMNAVLSVCRAMTQTPADLSIEPYPPSQIPYVPFFPGK